MHVDRTRRPSTKRLCAGLELEAPSYFCTRCGCCEEHCPCRSELERAQDSADMPELVEFAVEPCPICSERRTANSTEIL